MELLIYLQNTPMAFYTSVGILGLLVGSFLNVVIYRLPVMMEKEWQSQAQEFLHELHINEQQSRSDAASLDELTTDKQTTDKPAEEQVEAFNLVVPASTCPHCGHKIKPWENIPVISYLFLGAKCSSCNASISPRYPIIEAITGLLSIMVAIHFGFGWPALLGLILTWSLITLTMIDFDHQLLPDNITLPLLWLGLIANLWGLFVPIEQAVIGAVGGYLSLWSVFWLFKLVTGKEGMGYGDFKLLAAFGAWLGWKVLPLIIIASSLVGAIVGITLILALGRDKNVPIPFGPYLAAAGWITLLWGDIITTQYLNLLF